jgi:hypothetical protein
VLLYKSRCRAKDLAFAMLRLGEAMFLFTKRVGGVLRQKIVAARFSRFQ